MDKKEKKDKVKKVPLSEENVAYYSEYFLGNMAMIAKATGNTRQAVQQFVSRHPDLAEQVSAQKEIALDLVEHSLLHKAIQDKDLGAICFYLKTQGKQRGWVERQEVVAEVKADVQLTTPTQRLLDYEAAFAGAADRSGEGGLSGDDTGQPTLP